MGTNGEDTISQGRGECRGVQLEGLGPLPGHCSVHTCHASLNMPLAGSQPSSGWQICTCSQTGGTYVSQLVVRLCFVGEWPIL